MFTGLAAVTTFVGFDVAVSWPSALRAIDLRADPEARIGLAKRVRDVAGVRDPAAVGRIGRATALAPEPPVLVL